jgi:hypothetical protein
MKIDSSQPSVLFIKDNLTVAKEYQKEIVVKLRNVHEIT